jgi:hypothetical protein
MASQGPRPAKNPAAATVVGRWLPRLGAIFLTVSCGGGLAVLGASSKFAHLVPRPVVAAYLVLVAAATIWGCARSWRMEVRMDDHSVTVRNYFRTYRISWAEVRRFADGAGRIPLEGKKPWAFAVVLQGRTITANSTAWQTPPSQEMLTVLRDAAEAHGIPAVLTGTAPRQSEDGSTSPFLHL